jgi:hypothetical protein
MRIMHNCDDIKISRFTIPKILDSRALRTEQNGPVCAEKLSVNLNIEQNSLVEAYRRRREQFGLPLDGIVYSVRNNNLVFGDKYLVHESEFITYTKEDQKLK